ncbi:MAG TPA: hypothetical protein VGH40_18600 [Roseiarcus sp.]|jgi:hypothetical protein
MAQYALIEAGVVANLVEWDGATPYEPPNGATLSPVSSLPPGVAIGWAQGAGGAWIAPPASPAPALLTFLQFMALFTPTEQAAIVTSSDTQVKLFVIMASGAGTLDLTNAEVIAGVDYLASSGVITAAEATRILSGQATA